jgi:methylated-DNA-[protein]-cysteine S-methyltransferase
MPRCTSGTAALKVVDDMKPIKAPYYSELDSPIGQLLLIGDQASLRCLYMLDHKRQLPVVEGCARNDEAFRSVRQQLTAYFAGELRRFEVALAGEGSAFQKKVWQALLDIPFGETESYGQLARRIGNEKASRAVGLANGRNPISIIVPCHRVIGANGSLTGYGGGMERKKWLLEHEKRSS